MKSSKITLVTLLATLAVMALASSAFAVGCGGSPGTGAGSTNGLKVEGEAAGTKFSGIIELGFSNIRCVNNSVCNSADGSDTADAKVLLRLSRGNQGDGNVAAFYVNLGPVPFYDAGPDAFAIQKKALDALTPYILHEFFSAALVPAPDVKVYLKEISPFSFEKLVAPLGDTSTIPNDEYSASANLTIAVAY